MARLPTSNGVHRAPQPRVRRALQQYLLIERDEEKDPAGWYMMSEECSEDDEFEVLRVRVDPALLEQVKKEAKRLGTDMSTYVRWCIRTGLYLKDLSSFVRSKSGESD